MKRLIEEDYYFTFTVIDGRKNKDGIINCRNGHEIGDTYTCECGCPDVFCEKCMLKAFSIMEAVRSGGDLSNLGGSDENKIEFCCPDGIVTFRLEAIKK